MIAKRGIWKLAAIGSRLFLGAIFFTGGMSKLMPFPGVMGPVWLESALEPYGLGLFARFVAWSEALIGVLLFSRRFAVVGAVMMVPLLLNILLVTVSLAWQGTPYVVGVFLILNLYLLAYDFDRLRGLFADAPPPVESFGPWLPDTVGVLGIVLCLAGPRVHAGAPVLAYVMIVVGLIALGSVPYWRRRRRVG